MSQRKVTEQDFRMPEFVGKDPEDYEFRDDGKLARKDRWERGIRSIVGILGMSREGFEIDEVVDYVREMRKATNQGFAMHKALRGIVNIFEVNFMVDGEIVDEPSFVIKEMYEFAKNGLKEAGE